MGSRNLTSIKTNRKGQTAMDEKTKKLLGKLYKSHQDIIDAMIRFGSNDPDSVRAVENKIKSDSTKFQILYYKGQKKVIKETNQTHLLSDLIKLHMQYDDATREDIEKLFECEKWRIFSDDNSVTGYDSIIIRGKTYRVSNQRTRNPEYRQTIISKFGRKGYEVRLK